MSTWYHSQIDGRRQRPVAISIDYLQIRLRRMVQTVLTQEKETNTVWSIANTLRNKALSVFIKGAWVVLLAFIFLIFSHQTYERISHYLSYPVAVDVLITSTSFQQFPEVTVCYQDPAGLFERNVTGCNYADTRMVLSSTTGISTEEIWKSVNASKAIISAQEINGAYTILLNFTEESLTWGTCTTFRSSASTDSVQKKDRYFEIIFKSFLTGCEKLASMIYIHDHGDHPNLRQLIVCVTPVTCDIAITKRKFLFVNRRDSPCTSSTDLRACMEDCFAKVIVQRGVTNCRFPFYPLKMSNISNHCVSSNETIWHWRTFHQYMTGVTDMVCHCKRKCEHTTFGERMITYPSKPNTSTIVIRYDQPYETIVKERLSYGLIELFCDVGGNSGLFIGVSLLSVLQLGQMAARLSKKRSQFSLMDPLYKKVLKTYTIWKKQELGKKRPPRKSKYWNTLIAFKIAVIAICVCLLIMSSANRVIFFFKYPMQTIVDISFNMSLETPSLVLCPGDKNILKLQQKVAKSRNNSNPCDVKMWELFELPGMNCTQVWPRHDVITAVCKLATRETVSHQDTFNVSEVISMDKLKGKVLTYDFPHIPFYDGTCIDLNDGTFAVSPKKRFVIAALDPPQCGTPYLKAYVRTSTGNIDYRRFVYMADKKPQQIVFNFKEIRIDETGRPCISSEENEQCLTNCLNKKLFNQINCRLPYMPEADLPLCSSPSSVRQAHLAFRDLVVIPGNTEDCNCFPKCRTRFLEITHFIQDDDVMYTFTTFGPSHNVVESYVIKRAYSVVKLLCDLGGLIGSTLGLCLLGIMETSLLFIVNRLNRPKK